MEALSDQFTVIAWDAPGAGGSQDPPSTFGIEDWAHALAGLLDAARIQRAHIVGLSWGGLLAQELYRRAAHHLHGVHAGWVRVSGRAPDALTWELGLGHDGAPLQRFEPARVH